VRINSGGIPFASFPQSRFQPCPRCGASVESARLREHTCTDERLFAISIGAESARFEAEFAAWLDSPHGRFLAWLAQRDR
jgi:hypothetical protein